MRTNKFVTFREVGTDGELRSLRVPVDNIVCITTDVENPAEPYVITTLYVAGWDPVRIAEDQTWAYKKIDEALGKETHLPF